MSALLAHVLRTCNGIADMLGSVTWSFFLFPFLIFLLLQEVSVLIKPLYKALIHNVIEINDSPNIAIGTCQPKHLEGEDIESSQVGNFLFA